MTGPLDVDAIRARAEAATSGPWEAYDSNEGTWPPRPGWSVANDAFHNPSADDDEPWIAVDVHVGTKADAEFIAHARQDVPDLLTALAAAERAHNEAQVENERLRGEEVVVEGSFFAWSELPKILGNFMRSSAEYAREAKGYGLLASAQRRRAEAAEAERDAALARLAAVEAACDSAARFVRDYEKTYSGRGVLKTVGMIRAALGSVPDSKEAR